MAACRCIAIADARRIKTIQELEEATELIGLSNIQRRLSTSVEASETRRQSFRVDAAAMLKAATVGCKFEPNPFKPKICKLCQREKKDHDNEDE